VLRGLIVCAVEAVIGTRIWKKNVFKRGAGSDVVEDPNTRRPVKHHHQTDVFGLQILGSLARVDDSWIWQS
jgi:hypothetical protein